MPFKRDSALQNIPLSKQPFKPQSQIEIKDVTWSPQCNPPATRTNKRRALSLQDVDLHGWLLILHIVLEMRTIQFMHQFNTSFVFHFYILGLTSWIWTDPSTGELNYESPSKWNSYEGLNLIKHRRAWKRKQITPIVRCGRMLYWDPTSFTKAYDDFRPL